MPIPKPRKGENQGDFINRCMDDDIMGSDYPDGNQRLRVCFGSWNREKKAERENYKTWTKEKAINWLKNHDFKYGNYEKMANYHSFRQQDPDKYDSFRAEKAPFNFKESDGVIVIYGIYKKEGVRTSEIQTIKFYHGEKDKKEGKDMEETAKQQAAEEVAMERDGGDIKIIVDTRSLLDTELRIITISNRLGIKALYSLNRKKILEFYFDRYKEWDADKANEWYQDHKSIKPEPDKQAKRFFKVNDEKRIVYGVVLIPWEVDLQGDILTDEEVEKAAHKFVESFQEVDEMHEISDVGVLLESYIAPCNFVMDGIEVVKGSWILVTRAKEDVWEKIKNNELVGYSVGYVGKRSTEEA